MKHLYLGTILLIVLTSCHKLRDLQPTSTKNTTTDMLADTSIHHVILQPSASQYVNTSVSGDTLKMIYNENVTLMVRAKGYDQSWAVHLIEDFSNSALNNFDYTTVTKDGEVTYDWVDDNLNNVALKTVGDTTINNVQLVKINVKRPFTFSKVYDSNAEAVSEQQALLSKDAGYVTFASYIYFLTDYPTTTNTAKLVFK